MNQTGLIDSSLITPIAKIVVPTNKDQFRLYDDLDCDNWSDYVMIVGKITLYDDKLAFKNNGKNFTLRENVLRMITEYEFKTTASRDAKLIINFVDEIRFDIHA